MHVTFAFHFTLAAQHLLVYFLWDITCVYMWHTISHAEIDGFLCANCWMQAEYFCQSWKCVRESPKHGQKWSPQSTLTFSKERQTLQKHLDLVDF